MITTAQEYLNNLYRIQDNNKPDPTFRLPSDETTFAINLNTRTVKAPEFLSVAKDHSAETIYFKVDRYFDNMDLSKVVCLVQYINGNGDGAMYPVPFYDIVTEPGKIIFPWNISGMATAAAGKVQFSIRFFKIDEDKKVVYNLNTQPVSSKVLYGMDLSEEIEDRYQLNATILDEITQRLDDYSKQAEMWWVDL